MVERITVILFILLFLMIGFLLVILPWLNIGMLGDWGDNFLLAFITEKTGLPIIRQAIGSGWVRGAITGLGVLNLLLAFWEIATFKHSVQDLSDNNLKNENFEK